MELATALHHSAQRPKKVVEVLREVEEHETNDALRRQKALPPGARPGILAELEPQRSDRSLRRSSGDCLPRLATPSLAGAAGEAADLAHTPLLRCLRA